MATHRVGERRLSWPERFGYALIFAVLIGAMFTMEVR